MDVKTWGNILTATLLANVNCTFWTMLAFLGWIIKALNRCILRRINSTQHRLSRSSCELLCRMLHGKPLLLEPHSNGPNFRTRSHNIYHPCLEPLRTARLSCDSGRAVANRSPSLDPTVLVSEWQSRCNTNNTYRRGHPGSRRASVLCFGKFNLTNGGDDSENGVRQIFTSTAALVTNTQPTNTRTDSSLAAVTLSGGKNN